MGDLDTDVIVGNYFRRLEVVLSDLPQDRREQLIDELREHVREARAGLSVESVAAVHEILERIGTPEEIAAAEFADETSSAGIVAYLFRRKSSQRPSLTETTWSVLGASAGLIFVLGFLVSSFIAPSAPNINADVDTVTNYFNLNVHTLIASGLIETSVTLLFLVFLGAFHRTLTRANRGSAVPASVLIASGSVFAAIGALAAIFTTSLAILAGQSIGNLSSAPYVPDIFVLRTVLATGVFELAAAILLAVIGVAMVGARLVGRWFALIALLLGACNAVGGGAALVLGSYNAFWMVIQTIATFGIAFVILTASVVVLFNALRSPASIVDEDVDRDLVPLQPGFVRPAPRSPRLAGIAALVALLVAAAIAVPLTTRGSDANLTAPSATNSGRSSGMADVANSNSNCAPTTDAATSGGSPSALTASATKVASGTVEGKAWSLWSARGQSGATALEDGGLIFDGRAYGLCPGYPNPAELEMIDTGSNAVIYGVIGYQGKATIDLSVGVVNSFASGQALPSPSVQVVNGVSFFIGTLPKPACSYNAFELNTTSPGVSAQHNLGFGGAGENEGYAISDNAGNSGSCVEGEIDPISYSQGVWQLPPGQFSANP